LLLNLGFFQEYQEVMEDFNMKGIIETRKMLTLEEIAEYFDKNPDLDLITVEIYKPFTYNQTNYSFTKADRENWKSPLKHGGF